MYGPQFVMPAFWRKASVAEFVVSHMFCNADCTPLTDVRFAAVPVLFGVVTTLSSALPIADGPLFNAL